MLILILFAFIGGIITVLSPCILPLLPIILSSTAGQGKKRPLGIVTGFILSFTFFTLFLSSLVQLTGIPANSLRNISIVILIVFGLSLLIPQVQAEIEKLFTYFSRFTPNNQNKTGFGGGLVVGASLGLLWTPCVGPILASVISLAISGEVTGSAFIITLAYSLGTAIPMFGIIMGGRTALQKVPWLVKNSGKIQKAFGVLMILTAIGIYFNVDRSFQSYILEKFPNYGTGLTAIEDNDFVQNALNSFRNNGHDDMSGKPLNEIMDKVNYDSAPEIIPGGEWFNTEPLTISELTAQNKVVLIDFWTYTCINCIRTLPYLKDWWKKYEDDGLVIIGVHSPEFAPERVAENLARAIEDFEIKYPVAQDNDFKTWRAFNNRYWPAKYLIDKDGLIRYEHFGEGAYDETEEMIQKLLSESGKNVTEEISNSEYSIETRTPELYLGYDRMEYFDMSERPELNILKNYSLRNIQTKRNHFGFVGNWLVSEEYSAPEKGASMQLNFDAKNVFLVMRAKGDTSRVKVTLDGRTTGLGEDVQNGIVTVSENRLYTLVELEGPGNYILGLEFLDGEIEIFAFTFG